MARLSSRIALIGGGVLVFAGLASAQGRGGASWNTTGNDAQRSSWVATDPNISVESMQKPGFRFLWKVKANNETRLSQATTVASYIGYRGFRSYAFFGGASNNAIALDSDLGRIEWTRHFDVANSPAGTAACPGGMTAGVSRPTALAMAGAAGASGGRGVVGRAGGGAASAVGKPGDGAVQIAAQAAGGGRGGRGGGAAGGSGRGGAAGGSGRGGGGGGRGGGVVGANNLFAISSDGMLHLMYISNGQDAQNPIKFLPPNAYATGLIYTESDVFAGTKNNCGGAANGLWSVSLTGADQTVKSWKTNGGSVVGTAFGPDGAVFASTGDGDYTPASYSDAVVALDPKDLHLKDFFTPGKSEFTSAPVVFGFGGKTLVAAANKDGHIYLLDSESLGGADHRTPLAQSGATGNVITGDLSSFEQGGARWILAPVSGGLNSAMRFAGMNGTVTNGAVAAFKVVDQGGKPSLQPVWASRDMMSPLTPTIVNGVVFAVSGGDAQHPAVLYALDGATGKDLWNSGTTITSYARSPISGGASQLYLGTNDGTIYTFGFELVK